MSIDHFLKHKRAPTLEDVEVIGLEFGDKRNSETVEAALYKVFEQSGKPSAILKDGGSDLAKGVKNWSKENGLTIDIRDIGQIAANELKRLYTRNSVLKVFLKLSTKQNTACAKQNFRFYNPQKLEARAAFKALPKLSSGR